MAFFSIGARCKPWLQEFHVHIPQISVSFGAPNVSLIPTVWQHHVNLAAQIGERKVGRLCWPKCPLNVQRRLTVPVLSVRSRGYIWIEWAEIPGPLVLCCPGTAGMQNGVVSGLASPPPLFFSLFFLLVIQRVEEKSEEKEEGRAVCVCVCVCVCVSEGADSHRAGQVSHQPTVQEFRLQPCNRLGSEETKVQVHFCSLTFLCRNGVYFPRVHTRVR